MRRLVGVIVGFLLFFPGAMVLQWLVVKELRLYQEMTLTDALLAIIIILACVIIFGQPRRALTAEELEKQARAMELASRRIRRAREEQESVRRSSRSGRSGRPRSSGRSSRTPRSRSSRSRDDRRRR